MSSDGITQSALSWLREAETLRGTDGLLTLKRAYWEDLVCEPIDVGLVMVRNESYADAYDHCHEVSVEPTSGIVHFCSCAQFTYRNRACKHMVATALAIDGGELDLQSVGCAQSVAESS